MNQRTCDTTRLSQFLCDDLNSHDELLLTGHLDECTSCRDKLDELAADRDSWSEAKELLCDIVDQVKYAKHASSNDSLQIEQVLAQLAPTDDPDSLGRIGGYEVTGVIGSGGMGVVLKAHDRSLDRVVAVKVMAAHLAASGSARQRFAREAKAAAAVLHPNVIAIHGVSNDQSLPYLVMPYVRGASLQKRIDAEGPLPTIDILRIGSQVAAGLAAAHEQGLVHRDIKPANILLEQGVERVAITDFGLARAVDDASMTRSGVIAGTPQYMSPEQARGEAIDVRSDLFSLGSLLYAMCTGHSPFRAETSYGVLHRITHDSPRPIRELNPNIPEWLEKIVMKLLAKLPDDRFQTSQQVAELLEGCVAHVQHPTTTPLPKSVEQLSQLLPSTQSGGSGRKQLRQRFTIGFAAFAMIVAGILIVIETNKGTLTIESEANDVPIRIVQGKEIVERLTVLKSGTTTRLKAGEYTIEIHAPNSELEIANNRVSLSRGENEIVKIVLSSAAVSPLSQAMMDQSLQSAREQGGSPSMEAAQELRKQEEHRAENEVQAPQTDSFAGLRQIGLAFHLYYTKVGTFPGSAIKQLIGDRRDLGYPFSWRVAILPHIGQQKLFDKYRFDEPWDSNSNVALLDEMPDIFRSPYAPTDQIAGHTNMLGFATETGALGTSSGESMNSFTDGIAYTILIVETADSIPWTKPLDIAEANVKPFAGIPLRFVWADGSVGTMSPINPTELEKMITRNGHEVHAQYGSQSQVAPILNTAEANSPKMKVDESKAPAVDLRNARSVVEAYVALALAGDVAKAAALSKNAPADPKRIAEIPEFLNVQRLKIQTVYVNDPTKPTRALATSEAVKLDKDHKQPDGQRDGFMVFTLESTDGNWSVIDIDFESESGAEKELKRFLEANPGSIGMPPVSQAK